MHTHVLKTTTDKLAALMDEWLEPDHMTAGRTRTEHSVHHTGGRDWVVVLRHDHTAHGNQHSHEKQQQPWTPPYGITVTTPVYWQTQWGTVTTNAMNTGGQAAQPIIMTGSAEAVSSVEKVERVDTRIGETVGPVKVELYDEHGVYVVGGKGEKVQFPYGGLVQDKDETWLMFFDRSGRPTNLWLQRAETGAVMGEDVLNPGDASES